MKKVLKIDAEGFFVEDVLIGDNEEVPNDCIEIACTEGLYKPRWDGEKWIEGLGLEEVEALERTPKSKSEIEILRERLALTEQALNEMLLGG